MDVLIKAAGVAVVGALLALVLKKNSPETAMLLGLALCGVILYFTIGMLGEIVDFIRELMAMTNISSTAVSLILKAVGIGILARLASDICRDSGQAAASSAIELCGTAAILFSAIPIMRNILKIIASLL